MLHLVGEGQLLVLLLDGRICASLKGHCHAIWQLYKKLEGVFASIESQN